MSNDHPTERPVITAVMTVFGRRDTTLACLDTLASQAELDADLRVVVVDDASPDGTADAVAEQHPEVHLVRGTGDLFWVGGMRAALTAAMAEDPEFILWMNDDVTLDADAVARLVDTYERLREERGVEPIVVGSMRHPDDGSLSYGGVVRPDPRRPLSFEIVEPGDEPRRAETMNGNCVLVPRAVYRAVGNVDPAFRQKMGDFDYGLRAAAAGFEVWVAPGTVGTCATHPPRRTDEAPLADELRRLWSLKELPPGPWAEFTRRYGGPMWPVYFVSPYVRRGAALVKERLAGRSGR